MKKSIIKVGFLSALIAASCSKGVENQKSDMDGETYLTTSSQLDSPFNYDCWTAPWNIYDEIFVYDIDPDAGVQENNELLFYSAYAIDKLLRDGGHATLLSDIKSSLDVDGELGMVEFRNLFPAYAQDMDDVITNDFAENYPDLLSHLQEINGLSHSVGLFVPADVFSNSNTDPIVAFTVELEGPNSTSDENYANDYIPCFYPLEEESIEAAIGNLDGDDTRSDEECIDATVLVVQTIQVDANGNKTKPKNEIHASSTTAQPTSVFTPVNCEYNNYFRVKEIIAYQRYQRFGKSRVRWKYSVANDNDNSALRNYYNFEFDHKFFAFDMNKNDTYQWFTVNTDKYMWGYDQNGQYYPYYWTSNLSDPRNLTPYNFNYWVVAYEHDWYACAVYNYMRGDGVYKDQLVKSRSKFSYEVYMWAFQPDYDWCAGTIKQWGTGGGAGRLSAEM